MERSGVIRVIHIVVMYLTDSATGARVIHPLAGRQRQRRRGREMKTLFDIQSNVAPQPDEIVLQRIGISQNVAGKTPVGYVEIWHTDHRFRAIIHRCVGNEHRGTGKVVVSRLFQTRSDAIGWVYDVGENDGARFKISDAVESYCYPPIRGDWYRAAVLLCGNEVVTPDGEVVAEFVRDEIRVVDQRWAGVVREVGCEYCKPYNHRKGVYSARLWATWLLGRYMVKRGADFEWRQSLEIDE
jgi:hypothetical protein